MLTKNSNSVSEIRGRILVVDNDNTICNMIGTHFGHEGFTVDFCDDYFDLFSVDAGSYALIIISLDLEGSENALSIVEQIKQHHESASTGVITCSTNMSPQIIIETLNSGADDYLLKPFSMRELTARVRAVLRRRR